MTEFEPQTSGVGSNRSTYEAQLLPTIPESLLLTSKLQNFHLTQFLIRVIRVWARKKHKIRYIFTFVGLKDLEKTVFNKMPKISAHMLDEMG